MKLEGLRKDIGQNVRLDPPPRIVDVFRKIHSPDDLWWVSGESQKVFRLVNDRISRVLRLPYDRVKEYMVDTVPMSNGVWVLKVQYWLYPDRTVARFIRSNSRRSTRRLAVPK